MNIFKYISSIILLIATIYIMPLPQSQAQEMDFLHTDYCCGIADCGIVDSNAIHATKDGYLIDGKVKYFESIQHGTTEKQGPFSYSEKIKEIIPYSEAKPSPDGSYWRCKYPDETRRCFYAPPPGS